LCKDFVDALFVFWEEDPDDRIVMGLNFLDISFILNNYVKLKFRQQPLTSTQEVIQWRNPSNLAYLAPNGILFVLLGV